MRERTDGEGFATRAIHAGERPGPRRRTPTSTPIYATATFAFDTAAEKEDAVDRALAWEPGAYFYSRTGNPTNRALEEKIASLEGAEDCVVSSSGMAAVSATLFAHLGAGDHLVVGDELFAITERPARGGLPAARHRRDAGRHDGPRRGRGGDHARRRRRCSSRRRRTRACASPTSTRSPAIAHRHGLLVIADNTFLGPALLRPLEHGADLVLHAATKYLSGHGDAVSGVVSGPQGAHRPDPQADRHVRPGGQPVRELPRPARRPDAAAPVARRRRRTRRALAAFLEAAPTRSSGSATRASRRTRTTRSRGGSSATAPGRCSRSSRAAASTGMAAFTDHLRAVRHRRQPRRRLHARLPAAQARRAHPRLGRLRGHRRPARGLRARPLVRRLTAASAPARAPRRRPAPAPIVRSIRRVTSSSGRRYQASVAEHPRVRVVRVEDDVRDRQDRPGADGAALAALAHREQEHRRRLHLGRQVAAPAPADRRRPGCGS